MMQKNERVLLVPWVRYHAIRFGIRNLFVFDNGSDDKETILKLEMLEKEGLNVCWEYKEKSDFELKGKIISDKIKNLDSDEGYDFYFPMDCDEFLCVRDIRGVRIDKRSIENEINKYFNKEKIFYIDSALFNNPVIEDEFMILSRPEKCFFSNNTCNKLDTGFHQGEIKSGGGRQDTCISYIHFHNKPYDHYLFHARQKMKNRLENFGPGDAARYISQKGAGAHLVSRMLKTRDEYNHQFANRSNEPFPVKGIVAVPEFRAHLEEIGAPIIWTDRQEPPVLALDNGGRNSQHDIFGWWVDSGPNWTEMKGYVDAVQSDQGRVTFAGWACDRDGWPAPQLIVMADTDIVPTREFKTVYRPDVGSILPEVGPFCGFHIVVEAADVPPDTHELRLVSHDPRDRSTRIVQGRFGTAIRWSELKAGRNLWNVPDETDRGPRALLRQWKEELPTLPDDRRTRLHRADYLGPIRDGVRFFSQFQDGRGAIIDPYKGEEFQYSTPCFAFAAALAAREDDGAILTERAALAMDWSCQTLAERKAATGHEDFFPSPIAHALSLLADRVEPSRLSGWRKLLAGFDPFLTYRHKVGGSGDPGSNWNCKALAGEYLLHKAGVRGSLDYVERSLLAQGRLFNNEFGMYAEGPMVYDAFPRAWLGDMLAAGYDGQAVAELKETLDRGDATSLFLQSPNGELPCGGRSAHHIWADALQCVIFELAAAKAKKREELELAGIYKRAARKVLKAIRYWQRPSGEFWIVKNQSHPALRHGYEGYSSHSQYNLLALTALGYAYQHAEVTDSVDEQLTPSEGGHYVVDLPSPFNKVVANNNGTQVIVAHRRESTQTPVGLLRVHFKEGVPQIGPSDGLLAETGYALPDTKRANLSIGIAWRASEGWRSLPDMSEPTVGISDIVASRRETKFKMSYDIKDEPVSRVTETYCLSENRMQVDYELVGAPDAIAVRLPIIVSDGRNENTVKVGEDFVEVTIDRRTVAYIVQNAKLKISSELYAHRNGFARIAEFECGSNRNVRLTMEYSEKPA